MSLSYQKAIRRTFVIAAFGLLGSWLLADDKAPPATEEFTTPKAVSARKEYSKVTTGALKTCNDAIQGARKKYAEELAKSVKTATKAGDLKEAQRLQAVIDSLGVVEQPATPTGGWKLRFSHAGGETAIRFDGKGNVGTELYGTGTTRPVGDDWVVEFSNGHVMRLSSHGARFFVEQWETKGSFQGGSPAQYLAIGTRS
ncbi:MAG: hypothetical protein JWN70_3271 [Planctomycetaceae bacterium]|nr:hypothetical protein [Planctomycetaceae bacterium]